MRCLIVNGDDFGESPGVTAGILDAHSAGVLTSTSMIVTSPFSGEAARAAREVPSLSVGLHACLTSPEERFTVDPDDRMRCRRELQFQLQVFLDLMDGLPTHLDSHHNVHRDPRLEPLFVELADEYKLLLREHSPIRYFSSFYGQWDGQTHLEQVSTTMLMSMLREEVGEGVTELSCHPGRADDQLVSFYSVERQAELRTLCDPTIKKVIEDLDIRLISFREAVLFRGDTSTKESL